MEEIKYGIYACAINTEIKKEWKYIENNQEEINKAIEEGYDAFTTMSFAFEPENGKEEPNRKGDLWLDIDHKKTPEIALILARGFVDSLRFIIKDFNPDMLEYYLSGSKGLHICIPAKIYGDETGDPYLPIIQSLMVDKLCKMIPSNDSLYYIHGHKGIIDNSLYCMGKGHPLRYKNIRRSDGKYKVQITTKEFFTITIDDYYRLVEKPRYINIEHAMPHITSMEKVFRMASKHVRIFQREDNKIKSLGRCAFMQHCLEDSETLSENEWFMMLRILKELGSKGLEIAQIMSSDYEKYDKDETEKKFYHADEYNNPVSCSQVSKIFNCPNICKNTSPYGCLNFLNGTKNHSKYLEKEDGLYTKIETNTGNERIAKICSYIKLKGRVKNLDSNGWGWLFEI